MKFLASFSISLAASWISVCYSIPQQPRPYEITISDTDISITVDDIGDVIDLRNTTGSSHAFAFHTWGAGVRDSINASTYGIKCNAEVQNTLQLFALTANATNADYLHICDGSDLWIFHSFGKSDFSSKMMKGTIVLLNAGATTMPVVQYRRVADYDVGDDALKDCISGAYDCSQNFLTTVGAEGVTKLFDSCFSRWVSSPRIERNQTANCSTAVAVTPANSTADYRAMYEFQLGPIEPQKNATFYVYMGLSAGQVDAYDDLCKNKVEVASFFKPASSYLGLPYTYYVGYSGVGGNSSTFCSLSPSSGGGGGSSGGGASCFSGMNTVAEKSQGTIPITKLKIGDYVQTGTRSYTQVYGFGHLDHDREESFIQIHLDGDDSSKYEPYIIEISSKHLIFVDNAHDQAYPIRVENIVLGDVLNGRKVVKVSQVIRRGVYAPLTMSGDIMVSGVRVSNYVDLLEYSGWFSQHIIEHAVYTPRRIYCSHFMDLCMQETYHNGYGTYTQYIIKCASIVNDLGCVTIRTLSALVLLCGISPIYKFKGLGNNSK